MKLFFIIILINLTTSCTLKRSELEYKAGTQYVEDGDYEKAILHLENATHLNPESGKSFENLFCAYVRSRQYKNAWIAIRKAVFCRIPGQHPIENFDNFFHDYVQKRGLTNKKTRVETIREKLGNPDHELFYEDHLYLVYGLAAFKFKDGELVCQSFLYTEYLVDHLNAARQNKTIQAY